MTNKRRGWLVKQSFTDDFVDVMENLIEQYPDKMFEIQGIADSHTDLVQFSKAFFGKSASNVADVSVDSNANVNEKNITQYIYEVGKPMMRLNSLYLMYKWVKKYFNSEKAEKALEKVVSGELFINDLTNFSTSYSYYQQTPITIRVNGGSPRIITMKELFEEYKEFVVDMPDRENIDMKSIYKKIDFHNVAIGSEKRKTCLTGTCSEQVIQKHNVEVLDGDGKWVKLENILRHKTEHDFIIYQTKNGDMAFVTDNHPVIMFDGSEKNAKDLIVGDVIKGSDNHFDLKSIINVPTDLAYLIGFLLGDGSVGRHKFYQESKNITDQDIAIKVDELRGNIHIYQKDIVSTKIYDVVSRLFPECVLSVKDERQLVFNSNYFRMLLAKHFGINNECSYEKFLPKNILDWDYESVSSFVSGLIDSDGTINPSGSVSLRMSSFAIINQLSDVMTALDIKANKNINQIGNSTSGYNKDKMTFLFGICFQPNSYMIENSTKLINCQSDLEYNQKMDTVERNDEVCKIFVLPANTQKILPDGNNILEYVYDITTESGTFYSCGMTQHNCFAYDLRNLLFNGMNFFKGNMHIGAPQRSDSFLALMIQTTAYISNQILGASSYPDFFVALDWFYRKEMGETYMTDGSLNENWGKVRNQFQNLIFSLNFPFRGNQSPFTNLSVLDMGFLKQLFGDYTYPDETKANLESVCELSKKFFEYYDEVNGKEGMFTFPVMTLAISLDENGEYIDPDFVDWAAKANHKKALGNIFQSEPNAFSSCCRLRNEFDSVGGVGYQNSFGVGGTSIGSHRVAGLNLARISMLEKDNPDVLQEDLEILHVILRAHRHLVEHRTETGSLPLYSEGWMSLKRQYSTIGFIGAYEYLENKGLNVNTDEGLDKLVSLLKEIEDTCEKWQNHEKKDGHIYNIEQIPGESMAVRLAEIDSLLGYNKKGYKLYSNQYIPLIERASTHDRFRIQGHVDSITSGGAILHVNVDDEKPLTARQFKRLIEQARKSGTKYFAVNYAYSQCEANHYSVGRHEECPICNKKIIQQYTRVVGFITSINSWNKTRREYEYPRRVFYDNKEAVIRDNKKEEPENVEV